MKKRLVSAIVTFMLIVLTIAPNIANADDPNECFLLVVDEQLSVMEISLIYNYSKLKNNSTTITQRA